MLKKMLSGVAIGILGRRNVVRLGRFLSNEARLDVPNAMSSNGELMVQRIVLENAASPVTIFDVGANVGEWTLACAEQDVQMKATIYSFEPSAATFSRLQVATAQTKQAHPVHCALSNHSGRAFLNVAGSGAGTNSLHAGGASGLEQEPVDLLTADEFCEKHEINRIDLLKIDAEGHDMMVIEGARELFGKKAVGVVQFEYNWRWVEPHKTLLDAFRFFQPLGYQIGKITPNAVEFYPEWHYELEKFIEANYIACLPEWQSRFPQIKWWNL